MDVKKEYTHDGVTVVWKPGLCIHSGNCVRGLPNVFKPDEKPWIQAENASGPQLMEAIDRCPSGALSYYTTEGITSEEKKDAMEKSKVEVLNNGPLMVSGPLEIVHADGSTETKNRNTAFCRCGNSGNKPFCDGSHKG
ncbi:MAG: (4Fe-4S)-binding protein [Bacteroidia bacterium]|nr:(4Fe-4S)-binding protein [Bacteroidia bacterium]NNM22244.1 hypothetical protein [Flavobacteriaceae bacterium]